MKTHRDNVRTLMDDLAVSQAARRLSLTEQTRREEADAAMWIIAYGVILAALVVFVGMVWWGW